MIELSRFACKRKIRSLLRRDHGAPAAWLGTEGMYPYALYCAGIFRRAFFVKVRGIDGEMRKGGKAFHRLPK